MSEETNKVLEKQNEEPGKIIIDSKENNAATDANDQEIFAKEIENEVKQQETIKTEEKRENTGEKQETTEGIVKVLEENEYAIENEENEIEDNGTVKTNKVEKENRELNIVPLKLSQRQMILQQRIMKQAELRRTLNAIFAQQRLKTRKTV